MSFLYRGGIGKCLFANISEPASKFVGVLCSVFDGTSIMTCCCTFNIVPDTWIAKGYITTTTTSTTGLRMYV